MSTGPNAYPSFCFGPPWDPGPARTLPKTKPMGPSGPLIHGPLKAKGPHLPTPSGFAYPFRIYPPLQDLPSIRFTTRVHIKDANFLTPTFFKSARPPSLFCLTTKIGFGAAEPFCTFLDLFVDPQNVDVDQHRTFVR